MRQRPLFGKLLLVLIVTVLAFGFAAPALAVVVTPSAPDGWAPANVRTDATVAITTAQPRSGAGSLEFTTNTVTPGQDKADYQKMWDPVDFPTRTLSGLTALSYEYYRASSSTTFAHLAPVLRLYVADVTPTSPTFGKYALLIWEPAYNGTTPTPPVPTDQWITQDILNGKFWMFVPSGQSIPSGVVQNFNATLNDWITGSPVGQPGDPAPINIDANTLVFGINVGVGSGWGNTFRGFVDNVTARWGNDEVHANFEPDPPAFVCADILLDNFNRANTTKGLGKNWTGATNTYRIASNQAQPFTTAGTIFWNAQPRVFGADQAACVTLAQIDPNGKHHTLILKAQSVTNYARGMILVSYDATTPQVIVETIEPGQSGWITRLTIPVTFNNGDVLGAKALADGSVKVYRNGVQIGTATTSPFFVNRGGRIGVWFHQTSGALFDDFGGGNTTP